MRGLTLWQLRRERKKLEDGLVKHGERLDRAHENFTTAIAAISEQLNQVAELRKTQPGRETSKGQ